MQNRPHTTMIQRKGTQDHQPCNSGRSGCGMVGHQKKTHKQLQIHKKLDQDTNVKISKLVMKQYESTLQDQEH